MNAGSAEQIPSPEQLQISALTTVAKSTLDFRNPTPVFSEDGGSTRRFSGDNASIICDLGEVTSPDGIKTYIFGWPCVVATSKGPSLVGLEATWIDGGSEVNQRIVSGDATEFEKVEPKTIAKVIERHLGDPSRAPREGKLTNIRRRIGNLLTRQ